MGFGVLEAKGSLEHVPGTSLLKDVLPENTTHLKKSTGRDKDVVLIPQPSHDPNDPLNWPLWQRDMILLLICFVNLVCVGGIGPILAVITFPVLQEFHLTFTEVSHLTGYQLCTVGACAVFASALCVKYGKRGPSLLSLIILIVAGVVCASAATSNVLMGGRILQGFGVVVFESITFSVVGDLYYVHQRGSRMAVFIVSQSGLLLLPSLIAGQVGQDLGWRWVFWLLTVTLGVGFIAYFLFGWETCYVRNSVYNIDTSSHDNVQIIEQLKNGTSLSEDVAGQYALDRTLTVSSTSSRPRDSFVKRMKFWGKTYSKESFPKLVIKPFYTLLCPSVLWCVLIIAFSQLWNVIINLLVAQLFAVPPYSLTTAQVGYVFAGPIICGLLGCVLCGSISDPLAKLLAKRNNGIYEPEFRLAIMVLSPIFSSIGYFLFGPLIVRQAPIALVSFVWGLAFVSVQICSTAAGAYLVDAFRDVSVEVFVVAISVKSFLFFGFSFILNEWVMTWGPVKTFNTIGGIMLAISATTIPVYIYGKRIRAWWHKHDLLAAGH